MTRRKYPYDETVREIRELIVSAVNQPQISDDSDQWWTGVTGHSPMERQVETYREDMGKARELVKKLVEVGEEAAEAVAKGLRWQGQWRFELWPYVEKFHELAPIHDTLVLVSRRQRDPLAPKAMWLGRNLPHHFSFSIGGYLGSSYELRLEDDVLAYHTYGHGYEIESTETFSFLPDAWQTLIKDFAKAGVPKWKEHYENPHIMDGTSWHLYLIAGDLKINSSGSNDYPKGFERMMKAVRKLVPGKELA